MKNKDPNQSVLISSSTESMLPFPFPDEVNISEDCDDANWNRNRKANIDDGINDITDKLQYLMGFRPSLISWTKTKTTTENKHEHETVDGVGNGKGTTTTAKTTTSTSFPPSRP
jgi:hypothetical protein